MTARRSRAMRPAGGPAGRAGPPGQRIAPSISPDGRSIAYIMDTLQRVDIVDIANGTTTTIPLSGVVGVGGPVSWSPDGTTVLFNTFDGQQEHLVTAKSNGTDVREIDTSTLSAGSHVELWPAGWSPTGDRVAFVAAKVPDRGEGTCTWSAPTALTCRRSDPNGLRPIRSRGRLTPRSTVSSSRTNDDAGSVVQILDLPSGNLTTVGRGFWPTWSPDGSRIAYWNDGTVVVETAGALAGAPREGAAVPAVHRRLPGSSRPCGCGVLRPRCLVSRRATPARPRHRRRVDPFRHGRRHWGTDRHPGRLRIARRGSDGSLAADPALTRLGPSGRFALTASRPLRCAPRPD